jgi:rare lipoprotein A
MANGQRYNLNKLTAASNKYPLGAKIRVKNPKTGKSVVVIVTDRCKCYLDLSHAAFKQIGNTRKGYYNTKVAWIK